MNRRSLGVVAAILILLMVIVATAGLDNLPRNLKKSIDSAQTQLASDRGAIDKDREFLEKAIREEPTLFRNRAGEWESKIAEDRRRLDTAAGAALVTLQQFAKANRRRDADRVEAELRQFNSLRQDPVNDAAALRSEAERWLQYKRDLPKRVEAMRASYEAVESTNLDLASAPAVKAMTDWPAKKDDLQSRLDALKRQKANAEKIWNDTAAQRAAAEAGKLDNFDYATFFTAGDQLDSAARELRQDFESLNSLAAQLYTSWDKVLVDAGDDRGSYREKFKLVKTKYPDATLANGQTASEEKWEPVDRARYKEAEKALGMTVERKTAGKYDSEAERVVQPPAYAYIAPPGQSNAYGSWSGGVWHWLPQYLLLSQLLQMSRPPITTYDYDGYWAARRSGGIYYGRNDEYRPTWQSNRGSRWSWGSGGFRWGGSGSSASSGSSGKATGGWYTERPKSWGSKGYGGSSYQSRGTFGGSRYQSRGGSFSSRGFGGGRSFGRVGRR